MRRYFFNVRRDDMLFEDRSGVLLSGPTDAWSWALKDALSLIRQGHIDRGGHRYWIEVCDDHHCAVLSFPIGPMTLH